MNLSFRNADIPDIPLISELADKIWRAHYPPIISEDQINYMLRSRYSPEAILEGMLGAEKYFLAEAEGLAIAYASIELKNGYYYLHKFYLDVSRHRAGIGKHFFDFILTQTDPSKPIRLQVNRTNFKAVNFYFKVGFTIEHVGDFHIGGGYYMNDFVMVKPPNPQRGL